MIGILAGMGPRSTAPFIDMVIDECQSQYGARYDEEFPHMLVYSLPTPFYVDKPIDHEHMKRVIIGGLKKLEASETSFIAMPCNSAHIYFDELAKSIGIPLLNIVKETIRKLPEERKRISLFSTEATFQSGIYQKGIEAAGHEFVFHREWQQRINTLIQGIKANKEDAMNKVIWEELLNDAEKASISEIVIACTDLNAVTKSLGSSIKFVDSSRCLAEAVVREYLR